MHLGLGGTATAHYDGYYYTSSDGSDIYINDTDEIDLDPRPGFMAGMEFRFGKIFGVGPAFRVMPEVYTDTNVVDLLVTPTFHIPFKIVEVTIPINIGGSLLNGPYDESGGGFTFGVTPGVGIYFLPFMGVYANFGFSSYVLVVSPDDFESDSYLVTAIRPVMDTGITFAF